jgi:hypothetical protein
MDCQKMNTYREEKPIESSASGNPVTPKTKSRKKGKSGKWLQRVLSGDFLVKEGLVQHIPFISFLVALFLLNIGLTYYFENTEREKMKLQNEMNELKSQYNTTMSQLETRKQQSNVAGEIEQMGLKELRTPPQIIDVEKDFFETE